MPIALHGTILVSWVCFVSYGVSENAVHRKNRGHPVASRDYHVMLMGRTVPQIMRFSREYAESAPPRVEIKMMACLSIDIL